MFLNPVCLFWPSQLCASSRYCVAADEWVKNVLWDFSKRAVFKKTVALVSRAQQAHAWLTEYQPTSPSASAVFFRYKSFDFLAVSQVSSKLSRLSYGPVSVFFSFFFHLTESTANHCFAPKWLITAAFIWERGNSSRWSIFCCGAVIWCRSNIVTCCSST